MAKFRENRRISYVMKMSCKVLCKFDLNLNSNNDTPPERGYHRVVT